MKNRREEKVLDWATSKREERERSTYFTQYRGMEPHHVTSTVHSFIHVKLKDNFSILSQKKKCRELLAPFLIKVTENIDRYINK